MVYREATIDQRRDLNYVSSLKKWVIRMDLYSADCPACLRGRPHSEDEHGDALKRNLEASRA